MLSTELNYLSLKVCRSIAVSCCRWSPWNGMGWFITNILRRALMDRQYLSAARKPLCLLLLF